MSTWTRRQRRTTCWFAVAGLAALGGCGREAREGSAAPDAASTTSAATEATVSDEAGFDVGAAPGEFGDLPGTVMVGTAELAGNGCWYLSGDGESALLVAPVGTELAMDGTGLTPASGVTITDGEPVDVVGGLVELTALPGGPDGRWGNYVSFCAPQYGFAVVAETLTPAFDPHDVDPDELLRGLDASVFELDFGCGYGFATGDAAGRWALRIDTTSPAPPPPGRVDLPDERFRVFVSTGAHLFANHCDDVAEWFEPAPVVAAEWAVVAGTFDYPATTDEGCGGGPSVTTTLVGATIDTSAGSLVLDPIAITNDAFGCFAG